MLRDRVKKGVEMGVGVAASMQSGALVSDELVNQMVVNRLSKADAAHGFVLDGYPRTVPQAGFLIEWMDRREMREVVIHLAVDYNIIIARLTGRRECPTCGTLYNLAFHPPKVDSVCDLDGSKLLIRDDDRESVIRERLDTYERQTRPVLEYCRAAGRQVIEVDASYDPPVKVFHRICRMLESNDCS
jgi:adenylate kinase